jgi:hypothetical protein
MLSENEIMTKKLFAALALVASNFCFAQQTTTQAITDVASAPAIPARVTVCNPAAGEWASIDFDTVPWTAIMCNWEGSKVGNHHQRIGLMFNGAECGPWLVIFYGDGSAAIYCHRVLGS